MPKPTTHRLYAERPASERRIIDQVMDELERMCEEERLPALLGDDRLYAVETAVARYIDECKFAEGETCA